MGNNNVASRLFSVVTNKHVLIPWRHALYRAGQQSDLTGAVSPVVPQLEFSIGDYTLLEGQLSV